MKVIETIQEMTHYTETAKSSGQRIGFVPTMGFLHAGHQQLIETAAEENDIVVVSIFVNPLQFAPGEDYETYPRDLSADKRAAKAAGGSVIFAPSADEMYPRSMSVRVLPAQGTDVLCGRSRPGHFDGVLTVVQKLFHIIDPDTAYFGTKDAQQLALVENMVHDLNSRVRIGRVPTVREADGLAKSSRNENLTIEERKEAPELYQALYTASAQAGVGISAEMIEAAACEHLTTHTRGSVDYVELLTYPELTKDIAPGKTVILAAALKFRHARLIDNLIFTWPDNEGTAQFKA
ncbi:pantothenate synthetase [Salsuginibacillus halophilus]|uniref:Pantothenate synthetase n=1 Tax=Salsuginibacillus halophilus TaxID=517424 RepID=A0A2P8HWB9_9BACI|nr:pantoate--beta-alanine ligase [Salsuginibacillus halophilus]PSL50532.1 pantothenate synthetase [Salsuginibacillus halophilus]